MQGHSQCSSGSGGHEDANSDGAMLSRETERPGAVQVLTCLHLPRFMGTAEPVVVVW